MNKNNKIIMDGGIFIHILILGQDPRYLILERELKNKYKVDLKEELNKDIDISLYDIIILPMKGIIDNYLIEILKRSKETVTIYTGLKNNLEDINREVISFLDDNLIKKENDNITVNGIIDYINNISCNKICLLGFGNIGKKLYQKIPDKIDSIGIIDQKDKTILGELAFYTTDKAIMKQNINKSDIIINTVPNNIITEDICYNLKTPILDIASSPYGISKEVINKYNLNYYLYSGIPGKYDPERAGKILLHKIKLR